MSWIDSDWFELRWSPWHPPSEVTLPTKPGVYRIRSNDPALLAYVGQAENLADRILGHWTLINAIDPVEAKRRSDRLGLIARRRVYFGEYEISWATRSREPSHDFSNELSRNSLEKTLLWLYRLETRFSSFANHGRAASGGEIVGRGEREASLPQNVFYSRSRPLRPIGRAPYHTDWMGLGWTEFSSRHELRQGGHRDPEAIGLNWKTRGTALVKVLDSNLDLLKVGYRQNARRGTLSDLNEMPGGSVASWANLGQFIQKYRCQELRDDLVGAHYYRCKRPVRH